ncbi:MAG: hypothetical protein AAF665_02240 [Pseudomonadota bacterium]
MGKHLAFWIGVFATSLLIVPIALGIWGSAQGFARDWASVIFIVITTLVVLLVLALALRSVILRGVVKRGEASIEEVAGSLVASVRAAAEKDAEGAAREADKLARVAVGWYAWSSFYRWVIASALGLLLAFASFTGTVLLFEQIRKLEEQTSVMRAQQEVMQAQTSFMENQTARLQEQTEQARMQNEIMTLSLVSELRNQILNSVEDVSLVEFWKEVDGVNTSEPMFVSKDGNCRMGLSTDARVQKPAGVATQLALTELAHSGMLGERVVRALEFLLLDSNGAVAFTALVVLDKLDHPPPKQGLLFRSVLVDQVELKGEYRLGFQGSLLAGLDCPNCRGEMIASIAVDVENLQADDANIVSARNGEAPKKDNIMIYEDEENIPGLLIELGLGGMLQGQGVRAFVSSLPDLPACDIMRSVAFANPLVSMWE